MPRTPNHDRETRGSENVAPSREASADRPFDYPPLAALFERALRDIADGRLQDAEREAAARVVAFLLREQVVTERVATDVLVAIRKALDLHRVVRALLLGLRGALGDHEKIAEWTMDTAGRALGEGQAASFVSALRILVRLRDFAGSLPPRWRLTLIDLAHMPDPRLQARLSLLRKDYGERFRERPRWIREIDARTVGAGEQASEEDRGSTTSPVPAGGAVGRTERPFVVAVPAVADGAASAGSSSSSEPAPPPPAPAAPPSATEVPPKATTRATTTPAPGVDHPPTLSSPLPLGGPAWLPAPLPDDEGCSS